MNRKLRERAGKMFVFRFYASVNSLIDGKMFVFNGILFVFIHRNDEKLVGFELWFNVGSKEVFVMR